MNVDIDYLKKILSEDLDRIKNSFGNEIELKNDFYWNIKSDELYNPAPQSLPT